MSIIISDNGGGGGMVEAGVYPGVCAQIYDLGMQAGYEGKQQHKIVLLFELDERKDDGKRYLISRTYTASLNEKAALRKDLESWRRKPFTSDELQGFDIEVLKGVPCQINVVSYQKQNGTAGTKIGAILPPAKGQEPIVVELDPSFVPDWVRKARGEEVAEDARENAPHEREFDSDIPF
jgi:hypothetical protein